MKRQRQAAREKIFIDKRAQRARSKIVFADGPGSIILGFVQSVELGVFECLLGRVNRAISPAFLDTHGMFFSHLALSQHIESMGIARLRFCTPITWFQIGK